MFFFIIGSATLWPCLRISPFLIVSCDRLFHGKVQKESTCKDERKFTVEPWAEDKYNNYYPRTKPGQEELECRRIIQNWGCIEGGDCDPCWKIYEVQGWLCVAKPELPECKNKSFYMYLNIVLFRVLIKEEKKKKFF